MNTIKTAYDIISTKTDKYDLGYIDEFYESLFSPIQYSVSNLLEIGIFSGGSLLLWKEYFKNANIFGIDINISNKLNNEERIKQIQGNAYSEAITSQLKENFFDIIIDDGPHSDDTQKYFVKEYFKFLKPGGYMIVEDIVNIALTQQLIDLVDLSTAKVTLYELAGKQKTEHLKNTWSNGLNVLVIQKV